METRWKQREVSWQQLVERLGKAERTPETVKEYRSLGKAQQGKVKDRGGFVGGTFESTQRKVSTVRSRSLVTLDIDYGKADTLEVIEEALDGYAWALYSTHSHTKDAPRYRLVLPLSREVTPDEYGAISRRIAGSIDVELFDDSTYQSERLMYWPTVSIDGDFVTRSMPGVPYNADRALASYTDWEDASQWPVSSRVLRITRPNGRKQEDPTAKGGVIGAFCRCYGIDEAISAFLPDTYEHTTGDRYTYVKGSTANGALSYEDKWLYSHHGTDPAGGKLCNAFDLVRIHLFGDADAEADPDTPVNRMPSFLRMSEFASKDRKVSAELGRAKLSEISEEFAQALADESRDTDWMSRFQWHNEEKKDYRLPSEFNFKLICLNDPGLKGTTRHDVFTDRHVLQRDLPWARRTQEHRYWTDTDDSELCCYVSEHYRMQGEGALRRAHDSVMAESWYHPIRDYFAALPEWDGEPRLDTVLIDYLGAEDNELTRAMTRKHLCAAVARIMTPGCKYDYILTIIGKEGVGKSTLCKRLAGKWFNDSFSSADIGDKQAMEQLCGSWIIELGELKDYKHSTVEAFKAFASKQCDEYRPAYGRKKITVERQCVFFATTNEHNFLKGDTGNRRFWPVEVGEDVPVKDVFRISDDEVDQIWAEALKRWKDGEELYLSRSLEMQARARQAGCNEVEADERRGLIQAYIHKRLPSVWYSFSRQQRRDWVLHDYAIEEGDSGMERSYISVVEVIEECLGEKWDRYKAKDIGAILRSLPELEAVGPYRTADTCYGVQKRFRIHEIGNATNATNATK